MDSLRSTRRRAIVAVASAALLILSMGAGTAAATGSDHRNADNTFTKWITDFATGTMAGFVGGDVGDGAYAGQIMGLAPNATGVVIDAMYHFNGSRHAFSARVTVDQTGFGIGATAVITGRITEGWLSGNEVNGEYTAVPCTESPDGTCFQGTLDILRGSKHTG